MTQPHTTTHQPSIQHADAIVVGLGAMGSAAFYQLAKRGLKVIGLDKFHPPHDQGSTHGETRITRLSVGEGEMYMPLVRRSHDIWHELEAATGQTLFTQCGLLILEDQEQEVLHHGKPKLLHTTTELARKHGIAHELLSAAQIRERFPAFLPPEGTLGYFEPGAGYLNPEACVEAQLSEGQRLGGVMLGGQTVQSIEQRGDLVTVTTQDGSYTAPRVVMSTGAWLPGQVGGAARNIHVYRQVFHWFQASEPQLYTPEHFPAFIWPYGTAEGDYLYGFPSLDPVNVGVKLGTEQHSHATEHADLLERQVSADEMSQMWTRHTQPRLRGLSERQISTKTCMYSTTPDGDFVIDLHPDMSHVVIVSACSGHGFKHSAGVGALVADMVTDKTPTFDGASFDLIPFALSRLV